MVENMVENKVINCNENVVENMVENVVENKVINVYDNINKNMDNIINKIIKQPQYKKRKNKKKNNKNYKNNNKNTNKTIKNLSEFKPLKETIPKRIRELVWTTNNSETFSTKCFVTWCENKVNVFNFQVGHDIPESKGGTLDIDNLKPICSNCNLSMGNRYTISEWCKIVKK